jgi:23S rRNA (cytidine1920-2'-O)/16S rRNA (cytidine1409-2'-O)-methyltransferase
VSRGLAESRTRAQALIMAGAVFSGERNLSKAGDMLAEDAPLEVRGKGHPWVSRGGIKLDHGLNHFGFDVTGAVALDVGSSTGGFTDVLLSRGAAKVYAVDVGTNQLAWKLRQDPRVTVLEQTSARILTAAQIDAPCGWVVRDPALHLRVCEEVRQWLEGDGWQVQGIVESPITGPEGNVEFLIAAHRG